MASTRIGYNGTAVFGAKVAQAVRGILQAQQLLVQSMNVANAIANNGNAPDQLEGTPEFGVVTGQGGEFYAGMESLIGGIAAMQLTLSNMDLG